MKGKNKYLVLLILLLVICSGLVTYALFRTNKSGNANVNAARWNVVFKNGEEEISNNFNISLEDAEWTNELGNVASGKIAPGSQATFYITIDATNTETDVDYTVELDESFDESDFDVTLADDSGTIAYSTTSGEMIRQIPIQVVWNGNINDDDNKNETDLLKRARDITIPIKLTAAQKLPLKYVINFVSNGNIVSTIKLNENTALGTLPDAPVNPGATFLGWFDSNGVAVTSETIPESGTSYNALWIETQNYSHAGELAYFDPVTSNDCNGNEFNLANVKNGTSTCYKWRIISTSSSSITLQLDHNLINTGAWSTDVTTVDGPTAALANLSSLTSNWTNVNYLNYIYTPTENAFYGSLSCISGVCKATKNNNTLATNVRARIITKEEIQTIGTSNSIWNENGYRTSNSYGSLNEGFWTLSPYNSTSTLAWSSANMTLGTGNISPSNSIYYGLRPVISISKDSFGTRNVTFIFDDGTPNLVKTYNFADSLGELPVPNEREDFTFLGWSTTQYGTTFVNENTIVEFDTLYAIWQSTLSTTFEYNSNNTNSYTYNVSNTGRYQLEVWGAQGGNVRNGSTITNGGYGGYTTSIVTLTQGDTLFITLGGHPDDIITSSTPSAYIDGGYNGGGRGIGCSGTTCGASGGGATHIALNSGLLTTFSSNENRPNLLIVAAGGGGAGHENVGYVGGSAGGYVGSTGTSRSGGSPSAQAGQGGTQSSGGYGAPYGSTGGYSGTFGKGADAGNTATDSWAGAGGGAGLYGGGSGNAYGASGGGGSSYTKSTLNNKAMYCYNCTENSDSNTYTISTYGTTTHENERDTTACPNGYSSTPISKCAKAGNGYARITYLGE